MNALSIVQSVVLLAQREPMLEAQDVFRTHPEMSPILSFMARSRGKLISCKAGA